MPTEKVQFKVDLAGLFKEIVTASDSLPEGAVFGLDLIRRHIIAIAQIAIENNYTDILEHMQAMCVIERD